MPQSNRKLFHAAHYNAIAKDIRELYPANIGASDQANVEKVFCQRHLLEDLALKLAKRFAVDNDHFDPHKFLDACSPDPEIHPLSELWNA